MRPAPPPLTLRRPATLAQILLIFLGILSAAPALARIKVDRYQPDTLPHVELWVTVLDGDRPVPPDEGLEFSVHVNGHIVQSDIDWETAKDRSGPMAVGILADARSARWWGGVREQLALLVDGLPKSSWGFGVTMEVGITRLPEKDWSPRPDEIPPSLARVTAEGTRPQLYEGIKLALSAFPLREGLEQEDWEGPKAPEWKEKTPFPEDRVLFVIADGDLGDERYRNERMRVLVNMARRRDVRIVAFYIDSPASSLAPDAADEEGRSAESDEADEAQAFVNRRILEVIARKTGGTYRRAYNLRDLSKVFTEATQELQNRYILSFKAEGLRRGDTAEFSVTMQLPTGSAEKARGFSARVANVLGFFDRIIDWISDLWESLPWWAELLIWVVLGLAVVLIVLVVVVKAVRKRRALSEAAKKARDAALAARRPCAVCGKLMMPDWKQCKFCQAEQAQVRPMRFRLTGRNGDHMGQALRFDREIISVGSDPGCDVHVADRGVGSQHFGIRDRGDEFILTDFNTDTGTWVNGERVSQVILDEGDLIRVGNTEFVFGIEASEGVNRP